MKKSIFCNTLFAIFFPVLLSHAQNAVVSGNIKNTKAKSVSISYNQGGVAYKEFKQDFNIDKKGNFKLLFAVNDIKDVRIIIDEQQTSFYIQPGDSFFVKINYADFDNSITFSGSNSEKNNLLKAFNQKFITGYEKDLYQQNANRKAASFAAYCDSLLTEKINFISAFPTKPSADFMRYFKTGLVYENGLNKLRYPSIWAYYRHKGDTLPDMPSMYFNFMKKLDTDNDTLLNIPAYFEYLKAVAINYETYFYNTSGSHLTSLQKLQVAAIIFKNKKIMQVYEAFVIYNAFRYDEFTKTEELYLKYMLASKASAYTGELAEMYEKVRVIAPGQPAPAFSLADVNGKICNLSDYKGKVVYLDFWASWCGPCLRELPFSKKLKEEFTGKDVVFLYVSIDEEPKDWKEMILKKSIAGTHLVAPAFDHPVCRLYNISGVPTYFLIGKDGRIISNNPPRPSAEEALRKEIYAALQK